VMCDEFIKVHGPPLIEASRQGAGVLFLGAGALVYDEAETVNFLRFLERVGPIGFISRDAPSFERFARAFPHACQGIDCGFFVPDAYAPPTLRLPPYVALAFDSMLEPPIETNGRMEVRLHHQCWGPTGRRWASKPDVLVSDAPHDYLALYSQAEEVHTDRVHACVATLAYGRKARLYASTPRAALFDPVGAAEIGRGLVSVDPGLLNRRKSAQVQAVREIAAPALTAKVAEPHLDPVARRTDKPCLR
jgi:hypothetical protein